jgi:serine/threonine-protein kinase
MTDAAPPAPDPRLTRLAKKLEDRYEFTAILGRGGAGTVYLVMNRRLKREEALKVLTETGDPDFARRFEQEARVAASLDHPRIVKIYDFGSHAGTFWTSMQLVDGPTMAHIMEGGIRMDPATMARLAVPLLDALNYSHKRGVIHRDLKPANILVNTEGRPFLTDFGIAKTDDAVQKTLTGHMMGTPAYVSPEQALGERVDARSDLYSLGITLYELLAGKLPFVADSALQTVVLRLNQPPVDITEHCHTLHPALAGWLMKALAKDREERWESAAAMKEGLIQACEAAEVAWNQPMGETSRLKQLLPAKMRTRPLADLKPTMTLETPSLPEEPATRPWAWAGLGAVAVVVALLAWRPWARPDPAPAPAAPPRPAPAASPQSAAPVPAAKPAPAAPAGPAPAAGPAAGGPARRAVTAPVAEATPPPDVKTSPGCAGKSVALSVVVGEDGRVTTTRVLSAGSPDCAKAAQEAAARWRFKPALDAAGKPVTATVSIAVPFSE